MPSRIAPERVAELFAIERERFADSHPVSRQMHEEAAASMLSGVPMNWMTRWPGDFPVFISEAKGADIVCVDGHQYADLCLGDTGAMTGHSPPATTAAVQRQLDHGITTMLPSEAGTRASRELARRFGVPLWQFTLTATDANRFSIRLARQITGRHKILVHNWCYHGSVDETFATLVDGEVKPRFGSIGPPVPVSETTRIAEVNDLEGLERELANGDVACVLVEPALTNIGIVLPEPGYHDELRRITREHDVLLIIDETHTFCCGPGGYTGAHGLEPDLVTIGKPIAGGVPAGAYGMSDAVAERVLEQTIWDAADVGGIGGTLAGNLLSLTAIATTLEEVLTDEAFNRMIELGERFENGVADVIREFDLPWTVTRLGCRAEYMFSPTPPRNGSEAAAAFDHDLDALLHLYMLNRGVLMTPFHMMALMSPATTASHVDRHTEALAEAAADLTAGS